MAYEMNDMTATLFKNKKKESEKHPDRTGTAKINGVDYWMSGWVKQTKDGEQFLSMAFKLKESKQESKPTQSYSKKDDNNDGFDSDLPF